MTTNSLNQRLASKPSPGKLSLAGFPAVITYLAGALAARLSYPAPFSPARHWLSDLGDVSQNPAGSWMYNLGILLTAGLVLLFFVGFSGWKLAGCRAQNRMVILTQAFGALGSLALALSAVFPIDQIELHRIFSISLYTLLGTAFVFSVAALRYHATFPRSVLALGGAVALTDLASSFLGEVTWPEWIVVGLLLAYLLALSAASARRM